MKIPHFYRYLIGWLAFLSAITSFATAHAQMLTWATFNAPAYAEIRDVAFGVNRYVAVGDASTVCYLNGVTWVNGKLPAGLSCDLTAVEFAFGKFYAGGKNNATQKGVLLMSFDGINWSDISSLFPESDYKQILHLCAGLIAGTPTLTATYLRGGYWNDYQLRYTINGTAWSGGFYGGVNPFSNGSFIYYNDKVSPTDTSYNDWKQLKWSTSSTGLEYFSTYFPDSFNAFAGGSGGFFVGVGDGMQLVYGSNTNNGFTYAVSPALADYNGVAFGKDMFVAVGTFGTVVVSYDLGRKWNQVTTLPIQQITLNGVSFVGDKFIAYGGGRIVMGTPANKRNWTVSPLPNGTAIINDIASDGTILVAVGNAGQIHYSTTGLSWTKAAPVTPQTLNRVDYDPPTKTFYATGAAGTLLRSTNGYNWTATTTGQSGNLRGVGRSMGKLVAGGDANGIFISSPNGVQWTTVSGASVLNFGRTVSDTGANQIFAYGAYGRVARSTNGGSVWQDLPTPSGTASLNDMTVYGGYIHLAGSQGELYRTLQSSPWSWTTVDTKTSLAFYGLPRNAQTASQLAAVGQKGLIYSQPSTGVWRLEMIGSGGPTLKAIVKHGNRWVVAGSLGSAGYVSTTTEN